MPSMPGVVSWNSPLPPSLTISCCTILPSYLQGLPVQGVPARGGIGCACRANSQCLASSTTGLG